MLETQSEQFLEFNYNNNEQAKTKIVAGVEIEINSDSSSDVHSEINSHFSATTRKTNAGTEAEIEPEEVTGSPGVSSQRKSHRKQP